MPYNFPINNNPCGSLYPNRNPIQSIRNQRMVVLGKSIGRWIFPSFCGLFNCCKTFMCQKSGGKTLSVYYVYWYCNVFLEHYGGFEIGKIYSFVPVFDHNGYLVSVHLFNIIRLWNVFLSICRYRCFAM